MGTNATETDVTSDQCAEYNGEQQTADANGIGVERRSADRTRDDAGWESKVVGRLHGRLQHLPTAEPSHAEKANETNIGWESSVLDILRRRIERGPN